MGVEKGGFRLAAIGRTDASRSLSLAARAGEGSPERELERLKIGTQAMVWNDTQSGSFVALPLIVNDEPAGVLLLYARGRDFFAEGGRRPLHELARDISFALHHLQHKAPRDYRA